MDSSRKKILGAFLVGFIMISVALFVKFSSPATEQEGGLAVVTTNSAPRNHIEVTDNNRDGIPDWQEALQRTEPVLLNEVSDTYEAESLTEEFSIEFLQNMVLAENYGAFGSSQEEIVENATRQLSYQAVDELYGSSDITIDSNNDPANVKAYANSLAQIVLDNSVPADSLSELEILKQAYATNDPERLEELDNIISMYKNMIDRSLALTVPSDYSKEHLDLVNVYNAIYKDILAMKMAFTDPIQTVVRLKRYEEDATSLYVVLLNLQKKMILGGVEFTENDPAYRFIIKQ